MSRLLLPLLSALCVAATRVGAEPAAEELAQAERAFAAVSVEKGMREAFTTWLAEDAIIFRGGPVNGRKWYAERPARAGVLVWEPQLVQVARSGDFGFSTGPWLFKRDNADAEIAGEGHFVSIWKKAADAAWKVAVDTGVEHPAIPGDPRDVELLPPPEASAGDAKALRERDQAYAAAWNRNPAEALENLASTDLRLLREGVLPAFDRNAAKLMATAHLDVAWKSVGSGISTSADLAYTYGEYSTRRAGKAERGSYLRIWRAEANGWTLVLDVWQPYPAEKPAKKTR